jgi:hypothetical protein
MATNIFLVLTTNFEGGFRIHSIEMDEYDAHLALRNCTKGKVIKISGEQVAENLPSVEDLAEDADQAREHSEEMNRKLSEALQREGL